MARSLNKSRMLISRIVLILAVLLVLFTRQTFMDETPAHELFDILGLILVTICAGGRIYTTAFLGGMKNQNLVDYGPFSIVRNPLYLFSLVGITGVALMSNEIFVMIGLPLAFLLLYRALISREEAFLEESFGQPYRDYKARVPRLWPNFSIYKAPDSVTMAPRQLWHAVRDAVWWFAPFVLFESIEYVQMQGWLPMLPF